MATDTIVQTTQILHLYQTFANDPGLKCESLDVQERKWGLLIKQEKQLPRLRNLIIVH